MNEMNDCHWPYNVISSFLSFFLQNRSHFKGLSFIKYQMIGFKKSLTIAMGCNNNTILDIIYNWKKLLSHAVCQRIVGLLGKVMKYFSSILVLSSSFFYQESIFPKNIKMQWWIKQTGIQVEGNILIIWTIVTSKLLGDVTPMNEVRGDFWCRLRTSVLCVYVTTSSSCVCLGMINHA